MKTFLVPTDYSPAADNAADYALDLARMEGAQITLLHVFHVPVPTSDAAIPMTSYGALEEFERKRLDKLKKQLENRSQGNVRVTAVVKAGLAGDEINIWCKENNPFLVIMGITGGNALKEFFVGSTSIGVTKRSGCDVLVIPPDAKFKEVTKISAASDLVDIDVEKVSSTLKHYCDLFNAKVEIINVHDAFTRPSEERLHNIEKIHSELSGVVHTIRQPYAVDTAKEIEEHLKHHGSGWLAVIHKDYNFFKGLFHKSLTKELLFHSHIPVLSIYQHNK